ncbi:hypothetical protein BKA63DRAFT_402973 [Paraphoma chrysanthemicola]|nr:hypothetical protein BKA63DRAFT_402973 [Paraphoma chrysanthemicola]
MITGPDLHSVTSDRITSAIELLWITVYCVKASFLAQFKFHKPLVASVSKVLTRFYWMTVGICGSSFLFTLVVPILLCHSPERCKYFSSSSTVTWEIALSAIDIVTDVLVIAIPLSLICMANFTLLRAAINAIFKSLSIFTIAIAITRMSRQSMPNSQSANYIQVTFWLMVEANVALIAASVSSYRIVVIDYLTSRSARGLQLADPTQVDDRHVPSTRAKDCQRHQVAKIANALTLHGPCPGRAGTVHA